MRHHEAGIAVARNAQIEGARRGGATGPETGPPGTTIGTGGVFIRAQADMMAGMGTFPRKTGPIRLPATTRSAA